MKWPEPGISIVEESGRGLETRRVRPAASYSVRVQSKLIPLPTPEIEGRPKVVEYRRSRFGLN